MQKITPFLWFNNQAEEAMKFYTSVFKDSKIVRITRFGEGGPGPDGKFLTGVFQINGQEFMVLDGGPQFSFTPAVSFFVNCETQDEIDYLWAKLSEGGKKEPCGWLQDKFGLSWQIVPTILGELLHSKFTEASKRAMDAMMKMTKLNIRELKEAYEEVGV